MIGLADEILSLIARKDQIEIADIQDRFGITKQTANSVIDFLVKFGFIEIDDSKRYVRLSEPCKKFFAEISD